jgi:hypothetical protein
MTMTALDKAKRKLRTRPIYFSVMRVVLPETGEEIGALVPTHEIDRKSMRERKYTVGKELRAELKQARNPKFFRKAHRLGGWLAENTEKFHGLSQHEAVKKMQEWSGIGCESVKYEIPGVGSLVRNEAESLNFDDMDEGRFTELWDGGNGDGGWIGWLRREVFGGLDQVSREAVELIIQKPQP